ncbi:hypothetical protein BHE74_00014113 [Ensete ventricosum]|nr:hypothetical protein BHE74_00014113 [Ensete ventricosum]
MVARTFSGGRAQLGGKVVLGFLSRHPRHREKLLRHSGLGLGCLQVSLQALEILLQGLHFLEGLDSPR